MKFKLEQAFLVLRQTLIVALISVVFTEVAFRIFNQINPTFIFYDNSYNRFRGKPFASDYDSNLNSKGFKDVEFEKVKAEGVFRILGIGDSFAFGVVPYQHNYHTLLEANLNRQGKKVETINMGIPNLNPRDYFAVLMNEGLEVQPDLVIVSFFIGNDFLDAESNQLTRPIYSYSYLASFFKFIQDMRTKYEGQTFLPDNWVYNDDEPTWTYENYLQMEASRTEIYQIQNPEFKPIFDYSLSYLQKIKEVCDYKNIPMLVVLIPDEMQVDPSLQKDVLKTVNGLGENFDFEIPNRLLQEELQRQEIDYIDLLGEFREINKTTRLYKQNDSHWNIAGNRYAAEFIEQYLVKNWDRFKPQP